MPQQKGMKRAVKVAARAQKKKINARTADLRRYERAEELEEEIAWSQKVYGSDFYFELQRHSMSEAHIRTEGIDKESWLYQNYLERVKNQEKVVANLKPTRFAQY